MVAKVSRSKALARAVRESSSKPSLTLSEIGWLESLAEGMTLRAIGEREGMTVRTLQRRLQNLFLRMGVHKRDQAIAFAVGEGLIAPGRGNLDTA
jgi:DNA-binding NarL/FixJ family response regulator